jgi:multidrug resistance efflux pump
LSYDPLRRLPPPAQAMLPWVAWATALVAVFVLSDRLGSTPTGPGAADSTPLIIASERTAHVSQLPVTVGQWVDAGTTLVVLTSDDVTSELNRATTAVAVAQARLSAQAIGLRGADAKELARLQRDGEQADADARVRSAELARQQGDLAARKQQLAEQEALVAKGATTTRLRDELRLGVADAEAAAAQAASLQTTAQNVRDSAARRTAQLRAALDVDGRLAPYAAELKGAEQSLLLAQAAATGLTIRAPRRLQVTSIVVTAGSIVQSGDTILRLTDGATQTVSSWLGESESSQVAIGDVVELTPRDESPLRSGRVIGIAAMVAPMPVEYRLSPDRIAPSRTITIVVDGDPVRPGQRFEVRIRPRGPS